MSRLRAIEVDGFRGVSGKLTIPLNGQSLVIYAENAVGKSSIADAVEWFYTDRVAHLWKENCMESALRSAQLAKNDEASVSLHFTEKGLDCTKSLSSAYISEYSNRTTISARKRQTARK
jgi:chromosome segregation ATPase